MDILKPGTKAPDFSLLATPDQKVSLHELTGKPVVLIFYPADWSPVCGDELALFNEVIPEFKKYHAQLVGISVDNIWSHLAFVKDHKLRFPLLSDFEPKGKAAQEYGSYDYASGVCSRSLFVINPEGVIEWSYMSPVGVNPGVDEVLEALEALSQKQQQEAIQ